MSSFSVPEYDTVKTDEPNIPSEGWHDATATAFMPEESRNGSDMMKVTWRVDNGEDKGLSLDDYFVFGLSSMIGERQLKEVCQAAGYEWETKDTLPGFVAQFPEHELRVGLKVEWSYSIEQNDQWENVPQERYEEHDGRKNINTDIVGYRAASEPSELSGGPTAGDGAPADDETFEPDDEMPF